MKSSVLLPPKANHINIFNKLKYASIRKYRYWNAQTRGLDLDGMLQDLEVKRGRIVYVLCSRPLSNSERAQLVP